VKHAHECAKRLSVLLKKLRQSVALSPPTRREPVEQLIYSFLIWNATHRQADAAFKQLMEQSIDINDLRVTDPGELAATLGNYPHAYARCLRMKQSLQAVYNREHVVDLAVLANKGKKEARAYLDSLEGMVPFVASSIMLLNLEGHAIPVDDDTLERLKKDFVVEHDTTIDQAASFIEHHVKHEDLVDTFQLLRAYIEKPMKVDLGPVPKVLLEKPKPPKPEKPEKPAKAEKPVEPVKKPAEKAPAPKQAKKPTKTAKKPTKTAKAPTKKPAKR
jgi:endonuclease III